MKLAISAIAWSQEDECEAFSLLKELGLRYVENIPARFKDSPQTYYSLLTRYGLTSVACQSLLFGTEGLHLFASESSRENLRLYLQQVFAWANTLGATSLVFGSPKNRIICGDRSVAFTVARQFFKSLGASALANKTTLCLEPNPEMYGCNFLTNTLETAEFVRSVESEGIKLNFDLGAIIVNDEDPVDVFLKTQDVIGHIHLSEPRLSPVIISEPYRHLAKILLDSQYAGIISIEMLQPKTDWKQVITASIKSIKQVFNV